MFPLHLFIFTITLPIILYQLIIFSIFLVISLIINSSKLKKYSVRLLVSIDQLVNTMFGGFEDETISSRLGKDRYRNWITTKLSSFLDWFESDHVEKSIEDDEGNDKSLL